VHAQLRCLVTRGNTEVVTEELRSRGSCGRGRECGVAQARSEKESEPETLSLAIYTWKRLSGLAWACWATTFLEAGLEAVALRWPPPKIEDFWRWLLQYARLHKSILGGGQKCPVSVNKKCPPPLIASINRGGWILWPPPLIKGYHLAKSLV
jgi:hypothetical protein